MICNNCNSENKDTNVVCEVCGNVLIDAPKVSNQFFNKPKKTETIKKEPEENIFKRFQRKLFDKLEKDIEDEEEKDKEYLENNDIE